MVTKFTLNEHIEAFFSKCAPFKDPLLVGFSGGFDSFALAHALWKKKIPLHLAHFDHAWRETSRDEALVLSKWAAEREIPFHMERGNPRTRSEEEGRKERYHFFERLYHSHPFSALVLAHHQLDQAETVLKRLFEGASLSKIGGMSRESKLLGIPVWRPLLHLPKKEVFKYLDGHGLKPLEDPTNSDPSYLRGRMRTTLFPILSDAFGKEIPPALDQLSLYSNELSAYVEEVVSRLPKVEGSFGTYWDLSRSHPFEIRALMQNRFGARRTTIDRIIDACLERRVNIALEEGERRWEVDRGRLFFLHRVSFPIARGDLQVHQGKVKGAKLGWKGWWEGKIFLPSPLGSKAKWWGEKSPAFLRKSLSPHLCDELSSRPSHEGVTIEYKPYP